VFEAQNPIPPSPLHTIYVFTVYNIHTGKGGELNQREGWRGNSSQSWVENTNMTVYISILQSITSDKHLQQRCITVLQYVKQEKNKLTPLLGRK
jgi:hypothetical protein